MDTRGNKFWLLIMCALIILLGACTHGGSSDKPDKNKSKDYAAKGRYLETNISLPENLNDIYALKKLKDGSIKLVASSKDSPFDVYSTQDQGKSWKKVKATGSIVPSGNDISSAAIDSNGDVVLAYGVHEKSNGAKLSAFKGKLTYIKVDAQGQTTKLPIALPSSGKNSDQWVNHLGDLKFASNNDLFGTDQNNMIYQIDARTGKIKHIYSSGDVIEYGLVNHSLLIVTGNQIQQYDIQTGKQKQTIDVLKKYLAGAKKSLMIPGNKKDDLYFCNEKGLYHYVVGGNVVEQLVDGSLSMLSSGNFTNMAVDANGGFLVTYKNSGQQPILNDYTFSGKSNATPSHEITVYSLNDNPTIKQQITKFQSENPNMHVNYEVGSSGNNGESTSDAIKTLNTKILAGKGPDVLILNGMPVDAYVEKGLLADFSDVIDKYTEKDEVFKNIAEAYKTKNKIYAAPIRFKVPILIGSQDALDHIHDLDTMGNYAENYIKAGDKTPLLDIQDPSMLAVKLFPVIAADWFNKEGSLSKSQLTDAFTQLKKIYDASTKHLSKKELDAYKKKFEYAVDKEDMTKIQYYEPYMDVSLSAPDIAEGRTRLAAGTIGSFDAIAILSSVHESDRTISYQLLNKEKHYFVPGITVGMSAKSKNQEGAKQFISYLFSEKAQNIDYTGGFPVNKQQFKKAEAKPSQDTMSDLNMGTSEKITWPDPKQFEAFTSKVETLTTPTYQDDVVQEALFDALDKCASGQESPQSAAKDVMEKLNLYLSE
ncbi:ABC transporter substrate-binding protein [Camelliibacillus cellulosilyticus]|uniref:ABC transporter substrate-binding protein n=1 Tax=Camelliibacillus cellulosilyticus TaxID=2174486 RepID=A0ABV9GNW6_9BACL